ncbi:chromosomal replication initiator protein DnaA [candidate division WS5 bacterium]|uniref:Chromosomal replication initiator protein DnaA n=1 Tax=candidate division WS5 bacterium TaxID=2093353 RepID=A0A419DGN4_9BACT|nr:MAG: chromosomal replication initiator protein DnaA [candidate division WS5 bacterium]
MDNKSLWQAALGELELSLSKANFTTWFRGTNVISQENGEVVIGVPNVFTKEWLENKYNSKVKETLEHIIGPVNKITYKVGRSEVLEKEAEEQKPEKTIHFESEDVPEVLDSLNPKYTFQGFVVGETNKLASAACQSVAKNPGNAYNPLFIYGGVGLGKTHLVQAIGNELKKTTSKKNVKYVTSEKFTNELINAIFEKKTNAFKEKYRKVDVLIVDDIQFLAGKEQTQEEFFHTFNTLHQANKQVVLASDRPPKAIPTLEERLRSRFEWGLLVDIQPPEVETRIAILQKKALLKGHELPLEIYDYIARSIQHNVRELEGALNRIIAYAELNNKKPDMALAQNVLGSLLSNPKRKALTGKQIMEKVADFFDIPVSDLVSKKRDKEIVLPRQVAMYLMREELGLSYPKISREAGKNDHTTAMHACTKIEKAIDKDEPLRHNINLIRERLYIS